MSNEASSRDGTDGVDIVDCRVTPGGVYGSLPTLVIDDEVTVQCRKYGYEEVKHLLRGFTPVDHDLIRPIFTRTFRSSTTATQWWTAHIERFLAGSASFADEQRIVVFGQTAGAATQFAEWYQYLHDHPDHDGTAALITHEDGMVEVIATQ
jgi:hypothetical protein